MNKNGNLHQIKCIYLNNCKLHIFRLFHSMKYKFET